MTAVTADRETPKRGDGVQETFVDIATAGVVYVGALANRTTTTGRASSATAAASRTFLGLVTGLPDGTGTGVATAGQVRARVEWGRRVLLNISTAIRTNTALNKNVFVLDNVTVCAGTTAGTAGVRVKVGTLVQFEASDKSTGWVWLRQFAPTDN